MIYEDNFRVKKNGEPYSQCFCTRPELIENYDKAIADKTRVWECHHRMEKYFPQKTLIAIGWYYDCEPEELIFLTQAEHRKVESACSRNSKANKGHPGGMKGKHHSEEAKRKMSESHKGIPSKWKGKKRGPMTDEHKQKISESIRRKQNEKNY